MKIRFVPLETVLHPETRAILFERLTMYDSMYVRETMADTGIDNVNMIVLCGEDNRDMQRAYAHVIKAHLG